MNVYLREVLGLDARDRQPYPGEGGAESNG